MQYNTLFPLATSVWTKIQLGTEELEEFCVVWAYCLSVQRTVSPNIISQANRELSKDCGNHMTKLSLNSENTKNIPRMLLQSSNPRHLMIKVAWRPDFTVSMLLTQASQWMDTTEVCRNSAKRKFQESMAFFLQILVLLTVEAQFLLSHLRPVHQWKARPDTTRSQTPPKSLPSCCTCGSAFANLCQPSGRKAMEKKLILAWKEAKPTCRSCKSLALWMKARTRTLIEWKTSCQDNQGNQGTKTAGFVWNLCIGPSIRLRTEAK